MIYQIELIMKRIMASIMTVLTLSACTGQHASEELSSNDDFNYVVDQFADLQILRYKVPGFESLTLKQKQLLYHLSEAALMGRDILYDQNCKYNLAIRRTLEAIYTNYKGNRDDAEFKALETYLKRVWFSNGIHHHYGEEKFRPGFSAEFFKKCVESIDASKLPLREGETVSQLVAELSPVICTPSVLGKRTVQSGDADVPAVNEGAVESETAWGYGKGEKSAEAFLRRYEELADILFGCRKLSGFCYTQLYDVEQEENGLYYYDRGDKLSEKQKARMRAIHSRR